VFLVFELNKICGILILL